MTEAKNIPVIIESVQGQDGNEGHYTCGICALVLMHIEASTASTPPYFFVRTIPNCKPDLHTENPSCKTLSQIFFNLSCDIISITKMCNSITNKMKTNIDSKLLSLLQIFERPF